MSRPSRPLSPFGVRLTELARRAEVSKARLAGAVGVAPSYMSDALSDPDWARAHGRSVFAARPEYVEVWAELLQCSPAERAELQHLALQAKARANPGASGYIAQLEARLAAAESSLSDALREVDRYASELQALGAALAAITDQMREAGLEVPQSVRDALRAVRAVRART